MPRSNGEFRGKTSADISNLRENVREIKEQLKTIESKLDSYHEDIVTLKTKAATWGGIAGFGVGTGVSILIALYL